MDETDAIPSPLKEEGTFQIWAEGDRVIFVMTGLRGHEGHLCRSLLVHEAHAIADALIQKANEAAEAIRND